MFITGAGGTYYADSDGTAVYGWKKIDKEYYYFDRESGKMFSGRKADGIRLKIRDAVYQRLRQQHFYFMNADIRKYNVATDTGHAWVELNGRVYDPLFAESRDFNSYYNVPYEGYGMRAVVRHKI